MSEYGWKHVRTSERVIWIIAGIALPAGSLMNRVTDRRSYLVVLISLIGDGGKGIGKPALHLCDAGDAEDSRGERDSSRAEGGEEIAAQHSVTDPGDIIEEKILSCTR